MANIIIRELRTVVKDEGVLIFFVLVPLMYPLLYSWIYNNETVRDVPVVVVDDCHSQSSRTLARKLDASPDVSVACYAANIDEARRLMARQDAFGIIYIPSDFDRKLCRRQQATVSVYCDMSLLLAYKAIYMTTMAVTGDMNAHLQMKTAGEQFTEVAIFNPAQGYGTFILPAVLMLIIQQTLALGIGMITGTQRERNPQGRLWTPVNKGDTFIRVVIGKSIAYFMIYAVVAAYLTCVIPLLFSFVQIARPWDMVALLVPFILACIFFAMTVTTVVRSRENVILVVVFASVPLLFISGLSWPQSNISWWWQSVSWLFP
ncbi:MAG: ABC transporter permease, partial [Prevotella sp.]